MDEEVEKWLNRDDVQTSLHTLKVPFHICTDDINYSGADVIASMLPVYDALLATGLQIMIYSGDVDGIVPTTGTRAWVEGLGLPVKAPWRPWLSPGKGKLPPQVGGYVTEYDGLTFATVRGAGHMVPYVQPQRGLQLFEAFLRRASPPGLPGRFLRIHLASVIPSSRCVVPSGDPTHALPEKRRRPSSSTAPAATRAPRRRHRRALCSKPSSAPRGSRCRRRGRWASASSRWQSALSGGNTMRATTRCSTNLYYRYSSPLQTDQIE